MLYTTLYEVKRNLSLLSTTKDDAILQDWIVKSSELITYWKQRRFDVRFEVQLHDVPSPISTPIGDYGQSYNLDRLFNTSKPVLRVEDLLEVVELLNGDETEILSSDYKLYPKNTYPKNSIHLKESSSVQWILGGDISLMGYFGAVSNYQTCWVNSGDKVLNDGGLDNITDVIIVDDFEGIPDDLLSPRFQIGQTLKLSSINGIEFVLIKNIVQGDPDYVGDDELHVVRGYNGTTPIAHPVDTPIYIYRVPQHIEQCCVRLVQWRYRQKDSDVFDRTYNLATQTATTPTMLPVDVASILGARGRFTI